MKLIFAVVVAALATESLAEPFCDPFYGVCEELPPDQQ